MQIDVLQWTAEEQALLDMYGGSIIEKIEEIQDVLKEIEDDEMRNIVLKIIAKSMHKSDE